MNGAFWSFTGYRDLNAHSSHFWGILVILETFGIFYTFYRFLDFFGQIIGFCRVFFGTFCGFRGYFGNFGDLGVCWPFKGFQGYFLVQKKNLFYWQNFQSTKNRINTAKPLK